MNSFDDGGMAVHQVLGVVRPPPDGRTGMPATRVVLGLSLGRPQPACQLR